MLIVEDDPHYAKVLLEAARDRGFKALVAQNGTDALSLARKYLPTAVTLDVFLPDMLGWTVLNQLKHDPTHASHSRAGAHRRGRAPVRSRARRVLVHDQSPRLREGLRDRHSRASRTSSRRACASSLVIEDDSAEQMSIAGAHRRRRRPDISTAGQRRDVRSSLLREQRVRLRDPRSQAAGHFGLRAAVTEIQQRRSGLR